MTDKKFRFQFKYVFFLVFLAIFTPGMYGKKIAELPRVQKPHFMTIGKGRLFIVDIENKAHIYQLKNNRVVYLKTFGKSGQGPGEFVELSRLKVSTDSLEIPTFGKYARFSLEGEFIEEVKINFMVHKNSIYKVGKNFVARHVQLGDTTRETRIILYDHALQVKGELGRNTADQGVRKLNLVAPVYSVGILGDKIYLIDSNQETSVKFFDQSGKAVKEIKLLLEPVKIDSALRLKVEGEIKGKMSEERWKFFKSRLYFPLSTPGLNYFYIYDNKMVARTYQFKGNLVEFVFFDMKGKELKRIYLHDTGRLSEGTLFCFHSDHYYYIKENEDNETWELFSEKVF